MNKQDGDKGKGTPGDTAARNKPLSEMTVEEKAAYDAELTQRLTEKKTQVEQLTEASRTLTEEVKRKRLDLRGSDFVPEPQKPEPKPKPSDDDEEPKPLTQEDLDARLAEERRKDQQNSYVRNVNQAVQRFLSEHDEYSEENDLGGARYEKLKALAKKTFLGDNPEEIYSTLDIFHKGMFGGKKSSEGNDTEGIGDTDSIPRERQRQTVDWTTKKLNPSEQKAATVYPGGEKAYRKAMAERG